MTTNNLKDTITIQLDTQHDEWNKEAYTRFVETLKKFVGEDQTIRYVNLVPVHVILSIDLISSPEHTVRLWEMAEQNAKAQANETPKHEINATALELQNKPRQTNINSPLSRRTTTTAMTLKRKADFDSADVQVASPNHQTGVKAGAPRPRYVYISCFIISFSAIIPDRPCRKEIYVVGRKRLLTPSPFHPLLLTRTKCT
jgi:hypothetical protein